MSSTPRTEVLPAQSRGSDEADDPQQGIHRLPVELLHLVLQCLWEDKPAILACSQVSRLWNQVAHPHLFAFLKIASSSDFVEFPASVCAHPDITRHVRKLELKNAQIRVSWTDHFAPLADFPEIDRTQLCDLVAPLPNLQELHLYELCLTDSPGPAPDAPRSPPARQTRAPCPYRAPPRGPATPAAARGGTRARTTRAAPRRARPRTRAGGPRPSLRARPRTRGGGGVRGGSWRGAWRRVRACRRRRRWRRD